ncbi:MAG: CoA pyrophosphatase [Myxococcota bacterium]|jgi:8-oxo-dGTP pyrophosphatase MutT (NUDIX family)|nr:CoA pyrophosphatase [Myxococcota bacterium]
MSESGLSLDEELRTRLQRNLDGFDRRPHEGAELKRAAVALLLLADEAGQACFVITRRAPRLSSHAGQWALPGGRLDPGESPQQAALRETSEEVGVTLAADRILGLMDDYPTRSGYAITPVVVWGGEDCRLVPNPEEVSEAYRVPVDALEGDHIPRLRTIPESARPVISVPMLGTNIHAPTAVFLYQLREVALHGRATRVDHFEQPVFAWR